MIYVELRTKIGTFIFKTFDKRLKMKYKSLDSLNFDDVNGKQITLFNDVLKTSEINV